MFEFAFNGKCCSKTYRKYPSASPCTVTPVVLNFSCSTLLKPGAPFKSNKGFACKEGPERLNVL